MTARPARAPVLLALVWLAGVVVATSVGLLAVRLVAAQVGDAPVPPLAVAAGPSAPEASADAPAPSPAGGLGTPSPTATSASSPDPASPATRTFPTAAGTLGVQCTGPALRLLYATPAPGWALDERSVSGSEAEVRFESDATRARLRVGCRAGQPVLLEQRTDAADGDDDQDDADEDDDADDADE